MIKAFYFELDLMEKGEDLTFDDKEKAELLHMMIMAVDEEHNKLDLD